MISEQKSANEMNIETIYANVCLLLKKSF